MSHSKKRHSPVTDAAAALCGTVLAILSSCGSAKPILDPDIPVDIAYSMGGEGRRLSELRRRPIVLVLMRTSEVVSQIYIHHVAEAFRKSAGRLQFLVLTVEPSEAPFIDTYVSFEKLPFEIGVAENSVKFGDSSLGVVPGIPCTYFIDSRGRPESVIPGVIETERLVEKAERFSKR